MMIECRHEPICISEAVIAAFSQSHTEADIIVPDAKPDIAKVLQVDASAVATSKECTTDGVLVEGRVFLNILYIGEDNTIKCINHLQNFKHNIDAKGAEPSMGILLECDVENVEYEVINSRKVNVRTIVALDARVISPLSINVITSVLCDGCEKLYKKIQPYNVVSRVDTEAALKEQLDVPAGKPGIASVLKQDVQIGATEVKTATNKLIIKGALNVTTLYIGDMDENTIQFMGHEIPFAEVIDVDGVDEEMTADIDFTTSNVTYELMEDSDGDCRALIADISIIAAGKVVRKGEIEILEDIYSTQQDLCIAKTPAMLDKMVFETKAQITINDIAGVPADLPEIIQVYNIIAKPYLSSARIEGEKIVIEGVIDTYVLYLSDDKSYPIYTYKHESNFVQHIDAKDLAENMLCDVKINIDHVGYNIGLGREIQLRFILSADAKVISTESIEYVSEITEGEPLPTAEKPKYSIKIYFAQKGDRVWDVAKKYRVAVNSVTAANDIKSETEPIAGMQIIIPQ
ncbi:MAG: DUF3794 domain-containing protein [Firmicutes bacterium]|nr:DUF3794 domain-containing protein [Bacillota bacterium]